MNDLGLIASHEQRIKSYEEFSLGVSATMAQLQECIKGLGQKVDNVGGSLLDLRADIAGLKEQNNSEHNELKTIIDEHSHSLEVLLSDRKQQQKRLKTIKTSIVAIALALIGGICTKWGEAIFAWIAKP